MEQLADHIPLMEESIRLAMKNRSLDEDLKATEAAIAECKAQVANYEDDLQNSKLRGSTRAGILNLLDAAQGMVEELEGQRAELIMHSIDRDKVNAEYEKVLTWCKRIKSEREELTYTRKRDFLHMIGATVFIEKQAYVGLSQLGIYELPYQRCRKSSIRGEMVMHLQIFFLGRRRLCIGRKEPSLEILFPQVRAGKHLFRAFH